MPAPVVTELVEVDVAPVPPKVSERIDWLLPARSKRAVVPAVVALTVTLARAEAPRAPAAPSRSVPLLTVKADAEVIVPEVALRSSRPSPVFVRPRAAALESEPRLTVPSPLPLLATFSVMGFPLRTVEPKLSP